MAENMIKFLRGNVSSLPQSATEGALYFTKDEGVYLGLADGTYHRYGNFIQVDAVTDLPVAGAHVNCMYYCVAENILAKWNGTEWVQINKQKTLAELGGIAKSIYDTKIAALEQADTTNATTISNLKDYVGTIPEGYTETNVVSYISKKAIEVLESATGGSSESAASVKAQLDAYKEENNPKVTANATAAANAKTAADNAQAEVDALGEKIGTVPENKTVVEMISDAQTAINTEKGRMDTFLDAAEVGDAAIDTLKELQDYISTHGEAATTLTTKVGALETIVGKAAEGENPATGLVKDVADNVAAVAKKADQTALDDVDDKVDANATNIAKIMGDVNIDGSFANADAALKTELQTYADTAESDAVASAKTYINGLLTWGEF